MPDALTPEREQEIRRFVQTEVDPAPGLMGVMMQDLLAALAHERAARVAAEEKASAEHTRYVLADAGWKKMNELYAALTADRDRLAALVGELADLVQLIIHCEDRGLDWAMMPVTVDYAREILDRARAPRL